MSLAETNTPRTQLLEQMIAQAQEKETKARKAEAIAWAELRGHTEELHRQQEVILEPLQTKYQSAYADRVTRMQRTRAVEHAASLSAAEASALRDLPQAPIEQLVALREKGLVRIEGPRASTEQLATLHEQGLVQFARTLHGNRVAAVLAEIHETAGDEE